MVSVPLLSRNGMSKRDPVLAIGTNARDLWYPVISN
jgi:hypothetical protein